MTSAWRANHVQRTAFLAGMLVSLTGASTLARTPESLAPPDWDAQVKLAEAVDRNPDPKIVEIDLTARTAEVEVAPGKRVKAWTYDGRIPGPLIRANVGDRLIVHFTNKLDEPTTIHWHGIKVPIEMDGVPDISQPAVEKGQSFTYDFVVPDAGLYWYHPHVASAAQVGFGLYGALLVEDPAEATTVGVADEVTLVLSDIGFDDHGVLEPADSGGSAGMVFGREGAYVLVNGRTAPTIRARAGAPQRWRIVNAAKSRYFMLYMEGQPFTIIGGDGGLQEYSVTSEFPLVTPGERLDIIVTPTGEPGSQLVVRAMLYNRGYGSVEYRSPEHLATVELSNDAPLPNVQLPKVTRAIQPVPAAGATPVPMKVTLPPVDQNAHSEFRINGVPHWKAKPYLAKLGETQLWIVENDTKWDHPFHLHGFSFMVLDDNDKPVRPLAWKDTVNIQMNKTARLLVRFDERPGTWMFHCHILDHADGGMMGVVHVGPGTPKPMPHDAPHQHD